VKAYFIELFLDSVHHQLILSMYTFAKIHQFDVRRSRSEGSIGALL